MLAYSVQLAAALSLLTYCILAELEVSLTHTQILVKNDQKHLNLDNFRIKKANKTHMLFAEVVAHHEFDNSYQLVCFMYKKAGNAYKLLPYKEGPMNLCDFVKKEELIYPELQTATDFPDADTCPWPARTYHVNGFQTNLPNIPKILTNGDYMVECQLSKEKEILQGFKVFGSVLLKTFG